MHSTRRMGSPPLLIQGLFLHPVLLPSPCSPGRAESCPTDPPYLQFCVPHRDCLGLSAPSPWALTELKLSQAPQWALGHRAQGKPSSAPHRPRAAWPPPGPGTNRCRLLSLAMAKMRLLEYTDQLLHVLPFSSKKFSFSFFSQNGIA